MFSLILYVYYRGHKTCATCLSVMCPHTAKPNRSGSNVSCLFFPCLCRPVSATPSLREDVSSPHAAVPEDAWCHLVYLIITLPALLHNAALSPHRHLKCLAGLFSETIMKLCAKAPQTVPPLFSLQPCVPEPEKDSCTAAQWKGKQTRPPFSFLCSSSCAPSRSLMFLLVTESNSATQVQ